MPGSVVCPVVSCARPRRMPGRVVCTLPLSWDTHPKVARNLTRSIFDIAHKRCNSNDSISMFEIIARELRATLLRNYGTTTAGIWRVHDADARRGCIVRTTRAHDAAALSVRGRVVCARSLSSATHPKVARNLTRSFFDIAHKRCNSNDSISMFEIIARELRATLLRNHSVEPQSRRAVEAWSRRAAEQRGCPPCSEHPRWATIRDYLAIAYSLRRISHPPARPTRPAATAR